MEKANWIIILLTVIGCNAVSYLLIRDILWSIVRLNIGGKLKKIKNLKKAIRKEEPFLHRITMQCLIKYVSTCQKEFYFWKRIKTVFSVVEFIIELAYYLVFTTAIITEEKTASIVNLVFLIQSSLIFLVLRIQFGIDGHNTKYDKKRMKN
ncbi:MAG: hypothetical protein IKH56_06655 [Oscillospiraceae bacterium]|nr:hypothetical protein [Oscillospiraceae bacterium]